MGGAPRYTAASFGRAGKRRGSSVVERTLGKGEAESSILSRGTIFPDTKKSNTLNANAVLMFKRRSRGYRRAARTIGVLRRVYQTQ